VSELQPRLLLKIESTSGGMLRRFLDLMRTYFVLTGLSFIHFQHAFFSLNADLQFQLSDSKVMTCQLIGKDDSSFDDSEVLSGRWQFYVDAYVSVSDNPKL
jgi:hypothetical protein